MRIETLLPFGKLDPYQVLAVAAAATSPLGPAAIDPGLPACVRHARLGRPR